MQSLIFQLSFLEKCLFLSIILHGSYVILSYLVPLGQFLSFYKRFAVPLHLVYTIFCASQKTKYFIVRVEHFKSFIKRRYSNIYYCIKIFQFVFCLVHSVVYQLLPSQTNVAFVVLVLEKNWVSAPVLEQFLQLT
jgi:hypothetical protein